MAGKLKGHHGVLRLFVKAGQLSGRVLTGTRAANAGSDLFPVGHTVVGIVAAEGGNGQRSDGGAEEDFFL